MENAPSDVSACALRASSIGSGAPSIITLSGRNAGSSAPDTPTARHGRRDRRLGAVGRQRLQRHGRHVRVGSRAAERPAAAGALGAQNSIHALAAHRAAGQVIAAVEREQREDGSVDALIAHPCKIRIRRGQIAPADLRRVAPDGGQGEDDARIVRGLVGVERALAPGRRRQLRHFGREVCVIARKIVAVRGEIAAARETEYRPLITIARRRDGGSLPCQRSREHRLHIRSLCRRDRQHRADEHQRQEQRQRSFVCFHRLPPKGISKTRSALRAPALKSRIIITAAHCKINALRHFPHRETVLFSGYFAAAAFAHFPARGVIR